MNYKKTLSHLLWAVAAAALLEVFKLIAILMIVR